ncbi:MAG: ATP-binding cassette domain-containing protein [Propionibacteriales bacterium]|nr:ATP-binding cassette domain-containing protein [Propionibacteriales bacterium]
MTAELHNGDAVADAVPEICRLENVTMAFGGVKALDDVSLALGAHTGITGIIGPNGAGKSTCLNVVAGARRPTSGRVTVLGQQLTRSATSTKVARRGVARTFQIPRPFAAMSVRENVLVAVQASAPVRMSRAEQAVEELLEQIGLTSVAGQLAGSLALASRKKLEVARAMAIQPRVLLLDEVFEGLSDTEIHEMVTILRGLDARGIRLVLVEHVLRALRQLATELVVFEKGTVIAHGDVEEVLHDSRVQEAYLGFGGAA